MFKFILNNQKMQCNQTDFNPKNLFSLTLPNYNYWYHDQGNITLTILSGYDIS